MNENDFIEIFNIMYNHNVKSKLMFENGVDLNKFDFDYYNVIVLLLKKIYSEDEVDYIIYSIYQEYKNPEIVYKNLTNLTDENR